MCELTVSYKENYLNGQSCTLFLDFSLLCFADRRKKWWYIPNPTIYCARVSSIFLCNQLNEVFTDFALRLLSSERNETLENTRITKKTRYFLLLSFVLCTRARVHNVCSEYRLKTASRPPVTEYYYDFFFSWIFISQLFLSVQIGSLFFSSLFHTAYAWSCDLPFNGFMYRNVVYGTRCGTRLQYNFIIFL